LRKLRRSLRIKDPYSEVAAASGHDQPIAREDFIRWIESASELKTLAKLHSLAIMKYDRIQPELGSDVSFGLLIRYLLERIRVECVPGNVQNHGMVKSRGATEGLLKWFYHLAEMDGDQSASLTKAVAAVTEFYLASNHELQDAIETEVLEHALEMVALRPYFEHWSDDSRLSGAWERASAWGKAHPNHTMKSSSFEIHAAFGHHQPIARENFIHWIESASDLETLSKLRYFASTQYDRIQPELGSDVYSRLAIRYFLECIRANVQGYGMVTSRFGATQSLIDWFYHPADMDESQSAICTQSAATITEFYLASDHEVQDAIEIGLLRHILEQVALRPYFEHWSADSRLSDAWKRALEWGKAHPDHTRGLLKQLHKMQLG
jgi:hypothetical protein